MREQSIYIEEARQFVCKRLNFEGGWMPEVGIVTGSGLNKYVERLLNSDSLSYSEIPFFPKPKMGELQGKLFCGEIVGRKTLIMQGRVHAHEGYSAQQIVFPVRLMIALGAPKIILTNAVSAIKRNYTPGDLVVIKDHISFFYPYNPLAGECRESLGGPEFPDMSETYERKMKEHALSCLKKLGHRPNIGLYAALPGPNYETPAEIHLLRAMGVDIVGMSIIPETIAAVQMGAKVLALSCVTNMAAGVDVASRLTHEQIMETSKQNYEKFSEFLTEIISTLPGQLATGR